MTKHEDATQAAGGPPLERGVRPQRARVAMRERAAFEKWLMDVHMLDGTWNEKRNCYDEFPCHLAFQSWLAARRQVSICRSISNLFVRALRRGR